MNRTAAVATFLLSFALVLALAYLLRGSGSSPDAAMAAPAPIRREAIAAMLGVAPDPDSSAAAAQPAAHAAADGPAAKPASAVPVNPPADDMHHVYHLPVPADAPWLGTKTKPELVVQLIADFQCGACGRAHEVTDGILKQYAGKALIVWRNYPLPMHTRAMLAHEAAMEVYRQRGNAAFWKYHDILYAHQAFLTRDNLEAWAAKIGGIRMDAFKRALDMHRDRPRIERDMHEIDAVIPDMTTPTFVVNGKLVRGALPYNAFQNVMRVLLRN